MDVILTHDEVQHKIRRIAYQIYEANAKETEIVLAGIAGGGYTLAQRLAEMLQDIAPMHITLCKVTIDKKNPLSEIQTSLTAEEYQNKSIVLIDVVPELRTSSINTIDLF